MIIDLKLPTIVVAGSFNPAIFNPSWMAASLYGIPEGDDVEIVMVMETATGIHRPYMQQVAIVADAERMNVFVDDLDDQTALIAEQAVVRAADTLPHTPVGAIGLNYRFVVEDPDEDITDAIKPQDRPERIGLIRVTELRSRIELEDETELRLTRNVQGGNAVFDFNYHRSLDTCADIQAFIENRVVALRDRSIEILNILYGIDEEIEVRKMLNAENLNIVAEEGE